MQLISYLAAATALVAGVSAQSHALTAWSQTGYSGKSFRTGTRGTFKLGFTAASYKYQSAGGDGCCAKTCMNSRETGYFCPARQNPNVASGNRFNKVVMGCGDTVLNC